MKGALLEEGFRPRLLDHVPDVLEELESPEVNLVVVAGECDQVEPLQLLELVLHHGTVGTVLLLMDRHCPTMARRALSLGAADVVAPPHSASCIALRYHVARLRRGLTPRSPPLRPHLGGRELDVAGRRLLDGELAIPLSGREFELLTRLLAARGDVVDRRTLMVDIWGAAEGTHAVLDATVHRLRRKLEKNPQEPRVLTTVRGVGYRLEGVGP